MLCVYAPLSLCHQTLCVVWWRRSQLKCKIIIMHGVSWIWMCFCLHCSFSFTASASVVVDIRLNPSWRCWIAGSTHAFKRTNVNEKTPVDYWYRRCSYPTFFTRSPLCTSEAKGDLLVKQDGRTVCLCDWIQMATIYDEWILMHHWKNRDM